MIAFIETYRADYGDEAICRALRIAPSSYYERRLIGRDSDRASARARRDRLLKQAIDQVYQASDCRNGARKVWHFLRREGMDFQPSISLVQHVLVHVVI